MAAKTDDERVVVWPRGGIPFIIDRSIARACYVIKNKQPTLIRAGAEAADVLEGMLYGDV